MVYFSRFFLIAALLGFCNGCINVNESGKFEPVDGYLFTPHGKFKFYSRDRLYKKEQKRGPQHGSPVYARGRNSSVILKINAKSEFLHVVTWPEKSIFVFDQSQAFYQMKGMERHPIKLSNWEYGQEKSGKLVAKVAGLHPYEFEGESSYYLPFNISSDISPYFNKAGGTPIQDTPVRFYIPFTLSGEPYVIDVWIKYIVKKSLAIGIPGGGP